MTDEPKFRVLIAGGGVAALEALLALRKLARDLVHTTLFAPDPEFRYRPLSVTEPFGVAAARNLDLLEIALSQQATFLRDAITEVRPSSREVATEGGRTLEYDALLLAIGARGAEAIPGAITFRDSSDQGAFRDVLDAIDRGAARRIAFAVPGGATWPLGLYELALLTRAHVHEQGIDDVELAIVTPETRPLEVFGRRAGEAIAELLAEAQIELHPNSRPLRFEGGVLEVEGGADLECDRAVSLPRPEPAPIGGIPQQPDGFIPVDRFGGVLGLERVYAAGDATWFPIKQGGLAAQLADSAASAIAALAGAPVEPQPFRPVLRGALLTEWGPRYMRALVGEGSDEPATKSVLWWPPAKIAGRYLAPYLARRAGYPAAAKPLADLDAPIGEDATETGDDHTDIVQVALASADQHAGARDFKGALRWLEVAEDLELYLPREYELKRISWQGQDG
jgi:sulfide:quinone oxidoreductase